MDIAFSSNDLAKSDVDAKNGEVAVAFGALKKTDCTYGPDFSTKVMVKAVEGYQPIFLHQVQTGTNIIYLAGAQLAWAPYEDTVGQTVYRPNIIGSAPTISDITCRGDQILLATDGGLYQMLWQADHYALLSPRPDFITIEFGLQKVGHLSASGVRERNLMDVYKEAIAQQATSKGYFTQPFFVRYAYRLTDGTHIMQSAPVLMLPTVLPPIIEVITQTEEGVYKIENVDLSHNSYFELRYRVCDDIEEAWKYQIAAIDIYASKPIDTYDPDRADGGYIGSLTQLTDALDCGGVRGRHYPSRSGERLFSGHYSLADDNYEDQYVEDMMDGHHIWCIPANTHMQNDILQCADYFLISSIPYATIIRTDDFRPLPVITSDFAAITSHKMLDDSQYEGRRLIPTALRWLGDRLIMGSNAYLVAPPLPYRSCAAMEGQAAESASADIDITVYTRIEGKVYSSSCRCTGQSVPISMSLSRYMFYPDPTAFKITLKQGDICYELLLTTHPTLKGSYWWGGLNAEYLPDTSSPSNIHFSGRAETGARVSTFLPDNVLVEETSVCLGDGCVKGLIAAMEHTTGSNFGRYPLYALCSSGIWMLEYNSSKESIFSATLISHDGCVSRHGITTVGSKVAYICKEGVNMINATKVEAIAKPIMVQNFDIYRLPHIDTILRQWDTCCVEVTSRQLFENRSLIYDRDSDCLLICGAQDYNISLSLSAKSWTISSIGITRSLQPESMGLACDPSGNVVKQIAPRGRKPIVMVTRPIKLDAQLSKASLYSILVVGEYTPDNMSIVAYGSNDLYEWSYLQSSGRGRIENINLQPYRYIRIVILGRLTQDEYIYGILLDK